MSMEHSVSFPFKGRVFTLGEPKDAHQIWFVIHGYGQLASHFIRKFEILSRHNIFVIAPEGLSRFYLQDVQERMQTGSTRVGASWMTRENRLTDIENYLTYLNTIADTFASPAIPVTVLGFSQGAATATRWVMDGKVKFKRLILWAGILPPDIDFSKGREVLKDKETFLVYGRKDPFLNDSRFAEMNVLSEKLGISPHQIEFDGEHVIDEKTLLTFL
jgi:predicted esterase